jgi:hypothetical protein
MSMESLTFWYDGYHGVCNHPDCANRNNVDNCPLADEEKCESLRDIFDRLAAYENTGLTPERCAELAQSEKDGRLVIFPCNIGDTIYTIYRLLIPVPYNWKWGEPKIEAHEVGCFVVEETEACAIQHPCEMINGEPVPIRGYNGEWYRTREEAEAALDKQKGE